jgi:hypothetical protein
MNAMVRSASDARRASARDRTYYRVYVRQVPPFAVWRPSSWRVTISCDGASPFVLSAMRSLRALPQPLAPRAGGHGDHLQGVGRRHRRAHDTPPHRGRVADGMSKNGVHCSKALNSRSEPAGGIETYRPKPSWSPSTATRASSHGGERPREIEAVFPVRPSPPPRTGDQSVWTAPVFRKRSRRARRHHRSRPSFSHALRAHPQ